MVLGIQLGKGSMELFKNTNYDFLGWKWPFIIASLVLSVSGLLSIALHGGLRYGIDFKEGVLMTVKFAQTPNLEKIRAAMLHSPRIKGDVSVQNLTGSGSENTLEIGTEAPSEAQMNLNRQDMADVLYTLYGQNNSAGKLDFNNAGKPGADGPLA